MATFPGGIPSFTTKVDGPGNPVNAAHMNSVQDEIVAIATVLLAAWTAVAHDAGNFTATGGGSWTVASGDQTTFAYRKVGKTITVAFDIRTSTVAGTCSALNIAIPGGFTALRTVNNPVRISDNGTHGIGWARVSASGTVIELYNASAGNWAAATDATIVQGEITFETTT